MTESMFELLAKAFGRSQVPAGFRYYVRDDRPSAIQGPIFTETVLSSLSEILFESGIYWLFESTRTGQPPGNVDEAPPEHRGRVVLSDETSKILLSDLTEKNVHGFKRFVALYGGTSDLFALTGDDQLYDAVTAFSEGRPSHIKVLLIQFGDVVPDVIYVRPGVDASLDRLLAAIDIPNLSTLTPSKYREFKGEDLETAMTYLSCAEHDH